MASDRRAAVAVIVAVGLVVLGFSVSVNFPKAAHALHSDESTYYSLAHSLARDADFEFRQEDLARVWEEFPAGPEGIFLKRGKDVDIRWGGNFPFVEWVKREDPRRDRLYYAKSYLYSLAAAPFVWLAGTNGFLLLHAILLLLNVGAAYAFLAARGSPRGALVYALAFFLASAAPVYIVWLTPDFFNLSLVLYGYFLWSYKEVGPPKGEDRLQDKAGSFAVSALKSMWSSFLRSPASDAAGAAVLGLAIFSKPLNIILVAPVILLAAGRRQWGRAAALGAVSGGVVLALFLVNVAITGEFNYQGGDRKTFYGRTGFPFQHARATFDTVGEERVTERVPVEVLVNRDTWEVFRHNLVYVLLGRHTGLVPYFFPAVCSVWLFLRARGQRQPWQWLVGGTALASVLALILYMPFTYSGGGGPIGNRYFLGIYPALLFLTPPVRSVAPGLVTFGVGSLFTAQLIVNPFYTSFYSAEHTKTGLFRLLPVELSLTGDIPVNVNPSRARQPLAGDPPITAYFLDDNAYGREGDVFWVKGRSRAELIVRAPARLREDGRAYEVLRIRRLNVEIRTGDVANRITVAAGADRRTMEMGPRAMQLVSLEPGPGFPYRPRPANPTNYVYLVSIASDTGFTPLFTTGSRDNRFLGALVRLVPIYEPTPY